MRATTYNKSEIMKQAWMMFNNKFYKEFGKTMAKQYRNVTVGKNDWRVSYGRKYFQC